MEIIYKAIEEITEYENNPRNNDEAVDYIAESIDIYGFKVPLIVDKNGVIVAGHTRYKAAKKLGITQIPCIVADDLNEEQIKAFRLADNKVAEKAEWVLEILADELKELRCDSLTGFEAWEIENILNPFDENSLGDFFEPAEPKTKEPSMIRCPCCGGWFEE